MARLRNSRHERFAVEVASMVPIARAYVLAGFPDTQWARPNGSRLAHTPTIAARIQELREEFSKNAAIHLEYLQALLLQIATANVIDFFKTNENGKVVLKPISELDRDQTAAVSALKVSELGILDLKLHNKVEAINVLLKSMGAIVERHDHTVRQDDTTYSDVELARWIAAKLEDGAKAVETMEPDHSGSSPCGQPSDRRGGNRELITNAERSR
jgi:hypothetical protein